ncbi:MAG: phage holin family protein [Austwickia sp.]|nr:phage holin family protein [Actinomycetota bacterium]MCB1253456.1 phage holin family protein [Austwickia sp.]MCO5308341.1 phage holin family protein [Austwickia sp.]
MGIIIRTIAVALATALAAWLLPGIEVTGGDTTRVALTLVGVAVIIGLVNALVKPVVAALSGCLVILTFGLFLLVINALMLQLSAWLAAQVGLGFRVDGFWTALLGSIVISVVSGMISGALTPARRTP